MDIIAPKYEVSTVTVRQVYEAMEKNGVEHIRGEWFETAWSEETQSYVERGGCVMGQAAINLHAFGDQTSAPYDIANAYYADEDRERNLRAEYNLYKQLNEFFVPEDSPWYKENRSDLKRVGSCIIYWNDADETASNGEYVWVLPTYADVLRMAKEVLYPHFDKEIKLLALRGA